MEETCANELTASGDLPGSDLSRHPLRALLPWHSQIVASVGGSHLLHKLLLGTPASSGEIDQQESDHLWIPARVFRLGSGARRHGPAADPVQALLRDFVVYRHGNILGGYLEP